MSMRKSKPDTVTTTGYPCKIQRQVAPVVEKVDNAINYIT